MSLTAALEVEFGWRGLLIEPRREAYLQARQRRTAAGANVCVTGNDYHGKVSCCVIEYSSIIFKEFSPNLICNIE